MIGIMGKSGTGKSSLCNAIFSPYLRHASLNGCTRRLIVLPCSSVNAE
ncbi:hypothetical protein DMI70_04180 [Escherichia coli]|nr:hypothetical protein [Escherichia coli]